MSTITLLGIGILLLLCYKFLIYPTFVSPLSKIPNAHFSSPLSPLWILWIRKSRLENRTLLACHEKLGPIIRLGPSDISLNCLDGGIRTIYSGGFDKHDWYPRIFDNYGYSSVSKETSQHLT
jgi:unspecific monooxygenase